MIEMIFIGIILNHLGLLNGWCLFFYILGFIIKTFNIKIHFFNKIKEEVNNEV